MRAQLGGLAAVTIFKLLCHGLRLSRGAGAASAGHKAYGAGQSRWLSMMGMTWAEWLWKVVAWLTTSTFFFFFLLILIVFGLDMQQT
jgi:hypothetical protein